jgi:polar amino acid transport system substrate-binding protein
MTKTSRPSRRRLLAGGVALMTAPMILSRFAFAITPDEIKKRDKIIVGIQGDNPPWGFVNSTGVQEGFDADVAALYAKDLGVKLEFMALEIANRIPALTVGRVDCLFATMAMFADRAKAVQFSKPYVANIIVLIAPKATEIKTNADIGKLKSIAVPRASAMDTQVTKNAPPGTKILRFENDAAAIQAMLSGQVDAVGGNMFYKDRLNEAKPGTFEDKLEFQRIYNGVCTRLHEKEINASINAFIDRVKASGELGKIHEKWMKLPLPASFPDSIEGVPFVAS